MNRASTISRRLAAVLIADVVGYSRLMERNETGTHTRLRAVRDEVTDPASNAYSPPGFTEPDGWLPYGPHERGNPLTS